MLVIALDLVTYLTFPVVYDQVGFRDEDGLLHAAAAGTLIYLRAAILAALAWVLLRAEFPLASRAAETTVKEGANA